MARPTNFGGFLRVSCCLPSRPASGPYPRSHGRAKPPQSHQATLTVSAAASLADVLNDVQQLYEKRHPNMKLIYNFGGSGMLLLQIEQGAPVEVFISVACCGCSQRLGRVSRHERNPLRTRLVCQGHCRCGAIARLSFLFPV
jgi:hypothetical protein